MNLRTIKGLITGLVGLAVLFAGASLVAVPKAQALYCGVKTPPPGYYATNISCGAPSCIPRGKLFVRESSLEGLKDGVCVENQPAAPLADLGPVNDAR
jgi:hypothetical protein